ncbi:hypothetical protein TPHA_0B03220 [Tetrapisispora phaffii CBS 4417]|uniref:Uncharacterized protein n=1 Tax=Tetrapisispora phaffii (strain ATCC 24235 / CBS 4417 / NBRC 1672 / NRRL Y-8282 / UCD 70-5) TaxID=1071381 RepID=G8BPR3_TETPH|nr:hypothetical protein TPHA_0B03220 [Tetrapisispora phaffii CBS 4417]CCE61994.1 hypothetical protein TPHA_0B03220 [Tetrapisispora phaffii CBS 4417]
MAPTPRLVAIRHGQTEWSKSGQYTGSTDLPLTEDGVEEMRTAGLSIFQKNNLISPERVTYIVVSPRTRAQQTMNLMLESVPEERKKHIKVIVDEDVREWEYGDYEGRLTSEIIELRKSRGLDKERPWLIWRDGCENGESSEQFGFRLSRAIQRIRQLHKISHEKNEAADILLFAHGHSIRYLSALWFGLGVEKECSEEQKKEVVHRYDNNGELIPDVHMETYSHMVSNPNFLLCPGGMVVLGYSHGCLDEPALELSGAFIPQNSICLT